MPHASTTPPRPTNGEFDGAVNHRTGPDRRRNVSPPDSASPAAEHASFDGAFDDLWRIAYRVSFRILGRRTEAEDVAQEALIRAHMHWRKVHGHAEAWTAKVAGNLAIDVYRRRRHVGLDTASDPVVTDPAPAERIDLHRLLDRLPRRQRQVLVLRYLADQTEAATAAAMGCSVGSVKRHAHRALRTLREHTALATTSPVALPLDPARTEDTEPTTDRTHLRR